MIGFLQKRLKIKLSQDEKEEKEKSDNDPEDTDEDDLIVGPPNRLKTSMKGIRSNCRNSKVDFLFTGRSH